MKIRTGLFITTAVFAGATLLLSFTHNKKDKPFIGVVDMPDTSVSNSFYVGNRSPLVQDAFIKLPVTAVKPKGWLHEYLVREKNGLTGNLGSISAWLQKDNNAWLSKDGKGEYGWEEGPYWLKGYAHMGYL